MIEHSFFFEIITSPDFSDTIISYPNCLLPSILLLVFPFNHIYKCWHVLEFDLELFDLPTLSKWFHQILWLYILSMYVDDSKVFIFSPDLFSEVHIHVYYLLLSHFFRCIIDISNLTWPKKNTWFLIFYPILTNPIFSHPSPTQFNSCSSKNPRVILDSSLSLHPLHLNPQKFQWAVSQKYIKIWPPLIISIMTHSPILSMVQRNWPSLLGPL